MNNKCILYLNLLKKSKKMVCLQNFVIFLTDFLNSKNLSTVY
jgi:hypothetical protein